LEAGVRVIAVPMAVLRRLPIVPPVPDRQRAAWERSGLAHNAKLHMPLNRAAALRPELDADPARAMLTTWNDDPWAGESYSAGTLTAARGDPDILAAPAGRIHFAGEHTAGHWAGTMEGALRSGQRVAGEMLASRPAAR
jgi:monoamine oxidase